MVGKEREPESETNPCLDAAGTRLYQSNVGSVLWPAIGMRPEVQYATNIHSRYTKSPLSYGCYWGITEVLCYMPQLTCRLGRMKIESLTPDALYSSARALEPSCLDVKSLLQWLSSLLHISL